MLNIAVLEKYLSDRETEPPEIEKGAQSAKAKTRHSENLGSGEVSEAEGITVEIEQMKFDMLEKVP